MRKMSAKQEYVNDSSSNDSSDEEELQEFKRQMLKTAGSRKAVVEDESNDSDDESESDDDVDYDESSDEESVVEKISTPSRQGAGLSHQPTDDSSSDDENDLEMKSGKRKLNNVLEDKSSKKCKKDGEETERMSFRSELSKMSLEEILALKEKVAMSSANAPGKRNKRKQEFKRENKNRPREVTSKVTVPRFRDVVGVKSGMAKLEKRDPRFDSISGEFNEKIFKKSYEFIDEIKSQEMRYLKKELETEEDPDRIKKMKYLIQRMENQEREKLKVAKVKEALTDEKRRNRELMKEGKRPEYLTSAERKAKDLVQKYEELTKNGKLDNYIKRKEKKNLSKDRKRIKL